MKYFLFTAGFQETRLARLEGFRPEGDLRQIHNPDSVAAPDQVRQKANKEITEKGQKEALTGAPETSADVNRRARTDVQSRLKKTNADVTQSALQIDKTNQRLNQIREARESAGKTTQDAMTVLKGPISAVQNENPPRMEPVRAAANVEVQTKQQEVKQVAAKTAGGTASTVEQNRQHNA